MSDKTFILTNNHVVENADKIRVKFQNGREFDAKITGRDPQSDVAVVEIKTSDLLALAYRHMDALGPKRIAFAAAGRVLPFSRT